MCNCSSSCNCAPNAIPGPIGRGIPGPPNVLTTDAVELPAGSPPQANSSGVSPNQFIMFGIPAGRSPVFNPVVPVTEGSPASGSINNTDPLAPQLSLVIPPGAAGADGFTPVGSVVLGFTMPAVGAATLVGVFPDPTPWAHAGQWVAVGGAGATDQPVGWMVIDSVAPNFLALRNPGDLDGISVVNGYPSGLPQNAAPGTSVLNDGTDTQICVSGRNGPRGATGTAGVTPVITPVYVPPSTPPVDDSDRFVIYYNAPPGSQATEVIPYTWDGAVWVAGPNYAGVRGTIIFNGSADPNLVPPAGSLVGDVYQRFAGSTMVSYRKISVSTWTQFGAVPTTGTVNVGITHTVAGDLTIDLANSSYGVSADVDINMVWDDANYADQGAWTIIIKNIDASPINITYQTLLWDRDPAVTLPATIAANAILILRFIKNVQNTRYTFTSAFVPTNV